MKTVYTTSTGVEAHMILGLLQQREIEGHVEGEHLQGGVGEIHANDIVRVVVNDEDYDQARNIIAEFEAHERETEPETVTGSAKHGFPSTLAGFVVGLAAGVAGMYWTYNTPVTTESIDHTRDGTPEQERVYTNGTLDKVKVDRNNDGETDLIDHFDRQSFATHQDADDDFDGVFETELTFRNGQPVRATVDTNGDGTVDFREMYKNGVYSRQEILDPDTGEVRKEQHFSLGKVSSARYDKDSDGEFDVRYEYDFFEEIEDRTVLEPKQPGPARP